MRKTSIFVIAVLMLCVMSMSVFAAGADLKITGLKAGDTVTLYKIGSPGATNEIEFISGVTFANKLQPTSQEINKIAADIQNNSITPAPEIVVNNGAVSGTEFTYTTNEAGVFIAIIKSVDDTLYNPILLAANLTDAGLQGGAVDAGDTYKWGQIAVAKSDTPGVDKEASTGNPDSNGTDTIQTGSVGDRVTYTVTPDLPGYPEGATNKTMYLSDTMSEGLTFEPASLTIDWNDKKLTADENGEFKDGDTLIAVAATNAIGFNMSFEFDNLGGKQPVVTYTAVINDKAAIGSAGNKNKVEYFYSNNPTQGDSYTNVNTKPQAGDGIVKKDDTETVYTYEIAFKKVSDGDTPNPLAGAIFGVYADSDCTELIDTVETNAKGYAASAKVGKGTYYLKEIKAPTGYALNTTVTPVEASWTTATTTTTTATERTTYTSEKPSDPNLQGQVGWLKDNVFYAMDEFDGTEEGVLPAYLSSHTATSESTTFTTTNEAGAGVVLINDIVNTRLGELPSTGGMGTYLFTIIGVAVMVFAGTMMILTRRKRTEK